MWYEFARALHDKKPRWFIAENVRGLLSHDGGRSFETIKKMLAGEGYELKWKVLDARDYGVPQMRQRVFIIGFRSPEEAARFEWPEPKNPGTVIGSILEKNVPEKYFLNPETARKILARLKHPEEVMAKLEACVVKQNQRREVRSGKQAGALPASQSSTQAQFVVQQHHGKVSESEAARALTAESDGDRQQLILGSSFSTRKGKRAVGYVASEKAQTLRSSGMTGDRNQFILGQKQNVSYCLDVGYGKGQGSKQEKYKRTLIVGINCINPEAHQDYRIYGADGSAPCLASNRGGGSAAHPVIISRARGKFDGKVSDAAPTMTTSSYDCNHLIGLYYAGKLTIRRLTPQECERLQGWPDYWTAYGCSPGMIESDGSTRMARIPMSDTQRYRMTGNGVCKNVVEAVVAQLKKAAKAA